MQHHILQHMSDGYLCLDKDLYIVDLNHRFEKYHGPRSELIGKHIWDVMPEHRGTETEFNFLAALKNNEVRIYEDHNPKFGQFYEIRVIPTEDGISIFYNDITDRKVKEQQLREAETKFRRLAESNIIGIVKFDSDGKWLEANDAILRLLGYSRFELERGLIYFNHITPSDWHDVDKNELENLHQHGYMKPYEKEFFHKDGTRVAVMMSAAAFELNSPEGMAYIQDISIRKRSEERILLSAEAAGIAFFDWNVGAGEVDWVNPWHFLPSEQLKYISSYKASSAQFFFAVHPEDRPELERIVYESIALKKAFRHEFRLFTPDGKLHWVQAYGKTFYDSNNKPYRMVGTNIDISVMKRSAEALTESEQKYKTIASQLEKAVSIRDEFLSVASHELRTPITSLNLQTQILQRLIRNEFKPTEEQRLGRHLDAMRTQIKKLTSLVDDLLDVTRIANGKLVLVPEHCDLVDLVHNICESMQEQFVNARCHVDVIADGEAVGNWDRQKIEQVIVNLLSNAVKYGRGKPVRIFVLRVGDMARLIVRDMGIGISQEFQTRIFERFERAVRGSAFSGLGLGLFISKQIVAAHNGEINVHSEEGVGSTFTVDLPLATTVNHQPNHEVGAS